MLTFLYALAAQLDAAYLAVDAKIEAMTPPAPDADAATYERIMRQYVTRCDEASDLFELWLETLHLIWLIEARLN